VQVILKNMNLPMKNCLDNYELICNKKLMVSDK
jgi:hypothetical protein